MSGIINMLTKRYQSPALAEHLASNYVLGQLSPLVKKRVERLRQLEDYQILDDKIYFWENKLHSLNHVTEELPPLPQTWKNIQTQLNFTTSASEQSQATQTNKSASFGISSIVEFMTGKWFGGVGFACAMVLAVLLVSIPTTNDPLSYVAVLQDNQQQPQVVAATYGESKNLVLDIISLPDIANDETFELWVTSKTDNQVRSLGEIPSNLASVERQLTDAQWRLITDSADLIISIEEAGGSAIGEPSDAIISRGLCIRLSAWDAQS